MAAIEVRNLTFSYPSGVQALDDVSLRVGDSATAIVGQNGAGKTTLVKHFNGLLQATRGEVLVNGRSTRGRPVAELARDVGLVFQNPNDQIFNRSVWTEATFGPTNLGFASDRIQALVERALVLVGLRESAEENPYGLTLSERKLLCIASVVAMDTPIVVLDEPTTGQDQHGVRQIGALIRQLRQGGRTVIAITHDMSLVADAFDRVIVMAHGQVLLDGDARAVFSQPGVLAQSYVEPPVVTQLAQRLLLPSTPLTVDEFCAAYRVGQKAA